MKWPEVASTTLTLVAIKDYKSLTGYLLLVRWLLGSTAGFNHGSGLLGDLIEGMQS